MGLAPVCFVKDDDLVPTGRKCNLLLGETFDFVANDVDPSVKEDKSTW